MKKLLSIFLTLALMVTVLPTGIFTISASADTEGLYTYTVSNGEATITDVDTSISGDIVIPSTLGGYPVTSIDSYAFYNCSSLTNITMPDSVTSIYRSVFDNCSGLTNITIGNRVTSIGPSAFENCTSLTSITISDRVEEINAYAFYNCDSLTDVYYSGSYSDRLNIWIDNYNNNLDSATWHYDDAEPLVYEYNTNNLTAVITDCEPNITEVTIPSTIIKDNKIYTVTSVREYAFRDCISLTNIMVDSNNDYYSSNEGVLFNKTNTELIRYPTEKNETLYVIPDGVSNISDSAFYNCSGLTNITIPDSVTSMGSSAFYNCSGLTNITIGNSVTSIGSSAFENCTNLTSAAIGNGVTSIGSSAFSNCTNLTNINIPDSVTSIGSYAFYNCSGLTNITIGNSVTSIGYSAFYNCSGLTNITVPDSVTSIEKFAFYGCVGLEDITLPFVGSSRTVNNSYDSVFGYIFGYTNSSGIDGTTYQFDTYFSDSKLYSYFIPSSIKTVVITDATKIPYHAFYNCTNLTNITIPDGVTSIGGSAFYNCSSLTSITIPGSVTHMSHSDFNGCSSLESISVDANNVYYSSEDGVLFDKQKTKLILCPAGKSTTSYTIPDGVKTIYGQAFSNCTSLTSITIPDSVTSIDGSAFYDCTGLTSITIGSGVVDIGNAAFSGCKNLEDVYITDLVAWLGIEFDTYTYQANPLYYANNLYLNNELLTNLVIPQGVTEIKSLAFYNYTRLKSVIIPDSVTRISYRAFCDCSRLTSVTIPNSVTIIGNSAFSGCTNIKDLYITDIKTWLEIDFYDGGNPLYHADNLYLNNELLTDLVIPQDVTQIHGNVFGGYSKLKSLTIPYSVACIENGAFSGCNNIKNVYYEGSYFDRQKMIDWYSSTHPFEQAFWHYGNDVLIDYEYDEMNLTATVVDCAPHAVDVLIPNTVTKDNKVYAVTSIADKAFYNRKNVRQITIPDSVTSIGEYSFGNCSSLVSVDIGDGVTSIGEYAFSNCSSLSIVNIGKGVKTIENTIFSSCSYLRNITLTKSTTDIDVNAFSECNIRNITFKGTSSEWTDMIYSEDAQFANAQIIFVCYDEHDYADATCTLPQTCKDCGATTGEALGHSSDAGTVTKQPTCTEEGVKTYTCTVCGEATGTEAVPVLPHDYADATCTLPQTCKDCGATTGEALGHSSDAGTVTKQPTCTEEGVKTYTCTVCGEVTGTEAVPVLPHDYADATCTLPQTCKDCGATTGEALGHSSDAGTVTKQPTCTEEGVKTYTCTVCGEVTGTEAVPVLPHDYADATCKEPKTCKDCDATEGEALGHSSDDGTVTKQPTCTEEGVKTYICTVCGEVTGTEAVPVLPHNYQWVIDEENNCGKYGKKHEECTVCHTTRNENTVISATGEHTYDNDFDADCNICGYVREVQQDGWVLDGANWVYYAGGEKAVGWKYIGASWYYFNDSGVMQTGWQSVGGTWYYLADGGAMVTGWLNLGGTWYYLAEGGAMVTGWLNLNGTWYYLSDGGSMATGWQYIGNSWYYFTDGGSMMTGWLNLGGTWYYLSDSGNMVTDWQYIGNSWYYFHSGGNMATGWLLLGNTWYYLADGGNMLTGWHLIGGTWYLFNQSGAWIG